MKKNTKTDRPLSALITFRDATLGYGKNVILSGLDFRVEQGDFLGIIGPNGAGKTTILRSILGFLKPLSGEIHRDGSIRLGYVKQRQYLDQIFPFTALEVATMGRYGQKKPLGRLTDEDLVKIREAMGTTNVSYLAHKPYRDLSGGQKQRVLIARALCSEPDLLLLDEPTNDMDVKGEQEITRLLKKIQGEKDVTIILVSHSLHFVLNLVEKIIFLNRGRATERRVEDLDGASLSAEYETPLIVRRDDGYRYVCPGKE